MSGLYGNEIKHASWMRLLSIVIILFGLMTLKQAASVLFIDGPTRDAAGSYMGLVVWFNFLGGFAYILIAAGLWLLRDWAVWAAFGLAGATLVAFSFFGLHVIGGGAYEFRTIIAMSLRFGIWLLIGLFAYHQFSRCERPTPLLSANE